MRGLDETHPLWRGAGPRPALGEVPLSCEQPFREGILWGSRGRPGDRVGHGGSAIWGGLDAADRLARLACPEAVRLECQDLLTAAESRVRDEVQVLVAEALGGHRIHVAVDGCVIPSRSVTSPQLRSLSRAAARTSAAWACGLPKAATAINDATGWQGHRRRQSVRLHFRIVAAFMRLHGHCDRVLESAVVSAGTVGAYGWRAHREADRCVKCCELRRCVGGCC